MADLFDYIEVEGGRGKMVAKEDILPGQVLFREPPIMSFDEDFLDQFRRQCGGNDMVTRVWANYNKFLESTLEAQDKYLSLFAPTHSLADRSFVDQFLANFPNREDFDDFLEVYTVHKYNHFQILMTINRLEFLN